MKIGYIILIVVILIILFIAYRLDLFDKVEPETHNEGDSCIVSSSVIQEPGKPVTTTINVYGIWQNGKCKKQ